ncbi:hypothetical protein [Roseateles sp. LYH14W]|uniref:Uncharacterized protein n=1 Tax=Pelomonas parva TaxID=3299032 RepID=A0ABW7F6J8_9BURK
MSRAFARLRLGWMRLTLAALKTLILGLLVLWYALLPVTLIDDASSHWRLHGNGALPLGTGISSFVVAGVMTARLIRRVWLGPVIAAVLFVILEAGTHARWVNDFAWSMDIALLLVMALIWVGCAVALAIQLRRRVAPVLSRHPSLHVLLAGLTSIATGLIVLMHPSKLNFLGLAFAWAGESPASADFVIALYYSLSGFAAGFTLKLLWPSNQRLSKVPALALVSIWCALTARTVLDPENSRADLYAMPVLPALVLLVPVAAAVLAGLLLAHWPSKWSRYA